MVYLFGSGAFIGDRKIMKVGYTSDFDMRKTQYTLHNPLGTFIKTRDGGEVLELKLQLRLIHHRVEFLKEWFYNEDEVVDLFDSREEDVDKWLWENRHDTLMNSGIPLPGTGKRIILDELKAKFG